MRLACVLFLAFIVVSCGYGSNYNGMNPGPGAIPSISQLSPTSVTAGGPGFVLTVDGTNFGTGAAVYWNSVSHNATYLTGQQITTTISATEIANPGSVPVYVRVNGQNSNTMMFPVQQ
jgi:IPT/TIG domain